MFVKPLPIESEDIYISLQNFFLTILSNYSPAFQEVIRIKISSIEIHKDSSMPELCILMNQITSENIIKGKINKYFNYHFLLSPIQTVKLLINDSLMSEVHTITYCHLLLDISKSFTVKTSKTIIEILSIVFNELVGKNKEDSEYVKIIYKNEEIIFNEILNSIPINQINVIDSDYISINSLFEYALSIIKENEKVNKNVIIDDFILNKIEKLINLVLKFDEDEKKRIFNKYNDKILSILLKYIYTNNNYDKNFKLIDRIDNIIQILKYHLPNNNEEEIKSTNCFKLMKNSKSLYNYYV